MKFLHIADIHLGAVPDKGKHWSGSRSREIYESFYRVLDAAREEAVDMVLIAGDLFHRQPLKKELKEINYYFDLLENIQVVIIAGNHDYIRHDSYYRTFPWSDNVTFITSDMPECIYFESLNTCIYGLSYDHYEIGERLYDDLVPDRSFRKAYHILVAHGGDEKHIPMNMNRISEAGFDYVAMGHIHKPQILANGLMAYSGALEPVDKNDEGEHGYIIGECSKRGTYIEFVPFASRQYITLDVPVTPEMTCGQVVDLARQLISRLGREHIYKVQLTGRKDVDMDDDFSQLEKAGQVVSIKDLTVYDFDFQQLYRANKDNLIGMYIEAIDAMTENDIIREKALHYGIHALYQAKR